MSATPQPAARPATARVVNQLRPTAKLAGPVVVARAGLLVLVAVDTMMTGRAGALELAVFGLGTPVQVALLMIAVGSLQGTSILIAQAAGAGEKARCGRIWHAAMVQAGCLGLLIGGGLYVFGGPFLSAVGLSPELAAGGGAVLRAYAWGMPAILIGLATVSFLEALQRPLPGMMVMLAANLINAGLNWALIYGAGGIPALGAEGAVYATTIVRWLIMLALVGYVLRMADGNAFGVRASLRGLDDIGRRLRRLGLPLGLAQAFETTALMTAALIAGHLGAIALAGFQIAINLITLIFMCAMGIAMATVVRVGGAVGRRDPAGMAAAGWAGVTLVVLVMGGFALLLALAPRLLAGLYSSDLPVIAAAVAAISVGALFLVFDGGQAVLMGALRGSGDVRVPLVIQGVAFWIVGVPAAWLLSHPLGLGTGGLMGGLALGVVVSCAALAARFQVVTRRPLGRT